MGEGSGFNILGFLDYLKDGTEHKRGISRIAMVLMRYFLIWLIIAEIAIIIPTTYYYLSIGSWMFLWVAFGMVILIYFIIMTIMFIIGMIEMKNISDLRKGKDVDKRDKVHPESVVIPTIALVLSIVYGLLFYIAFLAEGRYFGLFVMPTFQWGYTVVAIFLSGILLIIGNVLLSEIGDTYSIMTRYILKNMYTIRRTQKAFGKELSKNGIDVDIEKRYNRWRGFSQNDPYYNVFTFKPEDIQQKIKTLYGYDLELKDVEIEEIIKVDDIKSKIKEQNISIDKTKTKLRYDSGTENKYFGYIKDIVKLKYGTGITTIEKFDKPNPLRVNRNDFINFFTGFEHVQVLQGLSRSKYSEESVALDDNLRIAIIRSEGKRYYILVETDEENNVIFDREFNDYDEYTISLPWNYTTFKGRVRLYLKNSKIVKTGVGYKADDLKDNLSYLSSEELIVYSLMNKPENLEKLNSMVDDILISQSIRNDLGERKLNNQNLETFALD